MSEKLMKQRTYGVWRMFFGFMFGIGFAGFAGIAWSDTTITASSNILISQYLPPLLMALAFVSGFVSWTGVQIVSMSSRGVLLEKFK